MQIASANSTAPKTSAAQGKDQGQAADASSASADTSSSAPATAKSESHAAHKHAGKTEGTKPGTVASSKVTLSKAAKDASEVDATSGKGDAAKSAKSADTSTTDDVKSKDGADAATDSDGADKPSPLKSFAYGSLGLQSPQEAAQNTDGAYSAGKWLAAAITVGGIISLLI